MGKTVGLLILAIVLPLSSLASDVFIVPAVPTTQTAVTLHVTGGSIRACPPTNATFAIHGKDIVVTLHPSPYGSPWGCYFDPSPYDVPVFLGLLAPGRYRVLVTVYESPSPPLLFDVSDAAPPFNIAPRVFPISGGTFFLWFPPWACPPSSDCFRPTITFDDLPVTISADGRTMTAPPHAPGPVDVHVVVPGAFDAHSFGFVRYFDPAAPPDPQTFARVLFPVLYSGPGAYSSGWSTEGTIAGATWYEPVFWRNVTTHGFVSTGSAPLDPALQYPNGFLVYPAHTNADWLGYSLRVRNAGTSFGTDIPVVPEESFASGVGFHNVPVVPGSRTTLRIYALKTAAPNTVYVHLARGGKYTYTAVTLSQPTMETPAFAIIPDLDAAFPLSSAPTMDIDLGDDNASSKYWALVTVTTNDTQQVTVIR